MSESIQQNGSEVAIVIYDAPLPPRYFRFTKKFIKMLFVVVPITLGLILMGILAWGLGTRFDAVPAPKFPNVLATQPDSKQSDLEAEIKSLTLSNQQLTDKLTNQPAAPGQEEPFLMAVKRPYGMQNLTIQNQVTLDQFSFVQEPNKAILKFQLISTNPEHKVTGHILVFMISTTGLLAYPKEANNQLNQGIKYSVGEPFAVSRLRPTNAEFFHQLSGDSVKFVVYIFSREGDLLLIKETESYKVGPKS